MSFSFPGIAIICCALGAALESVSAQTVVLKPKLVQGQVTYLELSDDVEQTVASREEGAGGSTTQARQIYGLLSRVESVKDGKALVGMTYDRIVIAATAPAAMDYDSDRKQQIGAANDIDPICRTMLGRTAMIEVGADGRVTGVRKFQEIVDDAARKASPNSLMAGMLGMMRPALFQMQVWDKPHALYANREVKIDDKWQTVIDTKLPLTGPLKYTYDCTLKEITKRDGRDVAIVEFSGAITAPKHAQPEQDGPLFLSIESGKVTGRAEFDIERGVFTQQSHETDLVFAGSQWTPEGRLAESPALSLKQKTKSTIRTLSQEQRDKQRRENAESALPQSRPTGR